MHEDQLKYNLFGVALSTAPKEYAEDAITHKADNLSIFREPFPGSLWFVRAIDLH